MKQFIIEGKTGVSRILLAEKIGKLKEYLRDRRVIIITDKNISHHYSSIISDYDFIEIGTGEAIKNIETLQYIYNELLRFEADRSTFILGFGGGIVCDMAGFAASTYMRGLKFGFVSSSLLSQVDASLGGKNGINFNAYKNIIGTFNQPEFVLCDIELLNTLPEKEFISGFAEIIKHTLIADYNMFCFLEENYKRALNRESHILEILIANSIEIKSRIVNADETEKGERRKLNFGHTIGHAIERNSNLSHGEAVSIGMMSAANISNKIANLQKKEIARIERLLSNIGLPTKYKIEKQTLIENIKKDKKRNDDLIHFIGLNEIGNPKIENISIDELGNLL